MCNIRPYYLNVGVFVLILNINDETLIYKSVHQKYEFPKYG